MLCSKLLVQELPWRLQGLATVLDIRAQCPGYLRNHISREGSKFVAELSFSDSFQVPRDLHRSQSRRTCRTPPSTSPVIGRAQQCRGRVMEPSELPMYGVLLERGPSRFQAFKPYAFLSTGNGGCFHEPDSVLQGTPCPRSAASAAKRGCRPGVG